jgi:hypothetical protein
VKLDALLVVPMDWLGKLICAGKKLAGITPVPLSAIKCGELAAESVMVNVDE